MEAKTCRKPSAVCAICGSEDHTDSETNHCINDPHCGGGHMVSSKDCLAWLMQWELTRVKFEHTCTFPEARNYVQSGICVLPVAGRTYAKAVAKTTINTATQILTWPPNLHIAYDTAPSSSTSLSSTQTETATIVLADSINTSQHQVTATTPKAVGDASGKSATKTQQQHAQQLQQQRQQQTQRQQQQSRYQQGPQHQQQANDKRAGQNREHKGNDTVSTLNRFSNLSSLEAMELEIQPPSKPGLRRCKPQPPT
jgi:hypothetical protein